MVATIKSAGKETQITRKALSSDIYIHTQVACSCYFKVGSHGRWIIYTKSHRIDMCVYVIYIYIIIKVYLIISISLSLYIYIRIYIYFLLQHIHDTHRYIHETMYVYMQLKSEQDSKPLGLIIVGDKSIGTLNDSEEWSFTLCVDGCLFGHHLGSKNWGPRKSKSLS